MPGTSKTLKRPDTEKALELLRITWGEIGSISYDQIQSAMFVKDKDLEEKIKLVMCSHTKAFRYALLTQVLAKAVDPSVSCLALQAGASVSGAFDARSFCKKTVVIFEAEKLNGVLGASSDPYVSKPLRHPQVSPSITDIKDQNGWENLYYLLLRVDVENDINFTLSVLRQTLLEVRKLLSQQVISPPSFASISTEELKEILVSYLSEPSQGLRSQAIVYALFKTFNEKTRTFATVTSARSTVADVNAKRVADVECRDSNNDLKLAVCVTDELDGAKLQSELEKAKMNGVKNVLVIGYKIGVPRKEVDQSLKRYGMNVSVSPLVDFIVTTTVMLNGEMRKRLVLNMYETLRELESPYDLSEWDKTIRRKLVL
jgi:hypothetical protein